MARLGDSAMTPAAAAMDIDAHRKFADACVEALAKRGGQQTHDSEDFTKMTEALRDRGTKLLDAWTKLVKEARQEAAAKRCYSPFDKDKAAGKPLLFTVVDENPPDPHSDDGRFAAPTSMRDVEPSVHFWLERRALGGRR
jgi:hypothetical protein